MTSSSIEARSVLAVDNVDITGLSSEARLTEAIVVTMKVLYTRTRCSVYSTHKSAILYSIYTRINTYSAIIGVGCHAAANLTLVLVSEAIKVNEAFRTLAGEVVISIVASASIVAGSGAAGVEVYVTVLALEGGE